MTVTVWLVLLAPYLEMNSNLPKQDRPWHRDEELPVSASETHVGTDSLQTTAISKRSAGTFPTFRCSCMSAKENAEAEKTSAVAGILPAVFAGSKKHWPKEVWCE